MTIWIDPPIWPAHDRLWSHVISDSSLAELHDFAAAAGLPTRSFEGDHYDVPGERHAELVAAGARPTTATDLARRLSRSGLRFRKLKGERPLARVQNGLSFVGAPHTLDVVASPHEPPSGAGAAVVLITGRIGAADPQLVLVHSLGRASWAPPGGKRDPGETIRQTAVREVAEETGLALSTAVLEPVGYERISIAAGQQTGPWRAGDNHIAVFGTTLSQTPPVAPVTDDVTAAAWVDLPLVRQRCGAEPWWPLVQRWLNR